MRIKPMVLYMLDKGPITELYPQPSYMYSLICKMFSYIFGQSQVLIYCLYKSQWAYS